MYFQPNHSELMQIFSFVTNRGVHPENRGAQAEVREGGALIVRIFRNGSKLFDSGLNWAISISFWIVTMKV